MLKFILSVIILSLCFVCVCSFGEEIDGKFLYFAYGSNLLKARIKIKNPSATFVGRAKLKNYRLDFALFVPRWRGAVATIVEDPCQEVWGALWSIDTDQIANIDKQEGVDTNWYYAKNVTVEFPNSRHTVNARVYIETVVPPKLTPCQATPMDRRPSITYLKVIKAGAKECGLPSSYINYLNSFQTNGKLATDKMRKELGPGF